MTEARVRPWRRFDDAITQAPAGPGVYEIKYGEVLLKVGIASNLRRRLRQHAKSAQSGLISVMPEPWADPRQVSSSRSILAKHLYFDQTVTEYNLCSETGRVAFLREQCWVRVTPTRSREEARHEEKLLEAAGTFRYVGRVVRRDTGLA